MTWARRARMVLYTAAFTALGWHGAAALFAGVWQVAGALYALALALAAAVYAEWSTAAAYADAVEERRLARPVTRAHARHLAAGVLAGTCGCDRWWTSLGTDHDPWCPAQTGDARRARTPHPRRRPVPGRRTAAAARPRRRHRPR
ncbi:hypothetical protein [Streptomyces sp. 049-1]|uniref:hypothetical protein n=1 Tax=Streptomyces sp. 049-1 TaxID=2789264 RepID=UPI003980548D